MLIVKWQPTAVEDLEAIIDYIANHNTVAAYDREDHILQSAEDLAEHPYKGRNGRRAGTRELLVHPNYWLVYEVSDLIRITNVIHTSRLYP